MGKIELFIQLAKSYMLSELNFISTFIHKNNFVGDFSELEHNNGGSWCRESSSLCKKYKLLKVNASKKITYEWRNVSDSDKNEINEQLNLYCFQNPNAFMNYSRNSIVLYKLHGINENTMLTQSIRSDIWNNIKNKQCLTNGTDNPEVDHKDGRKNDLRVMNIKTQLESDFQPLSKGDNDAKRQHCKTCKETNIRFDATRLKGFSISYTEGNASYDDEFKCRGCYWYDIEDFHKKISLK